MKLGARRPPVGLRPWNDLFDTAEMEHVCELVGEDLRGIEVGAPSTLVAGLQRLLIERLDLFIADHETGARRAGYVHVRAARQLRETAESVCDALSATMVAPGAIQDLPARLRAAWLEFIAMYSAPRVYHDKPKQVLQARLNGKAGGRKSPLKAQIAATARRISAAGATEQHELAGKVARVVGCTPAYVRTVLGAGNKRNKPVG